MRRRPNPYRVLAHALDAGDRRLAELLRLRLEAPRPPFVAFESSQPSRPAAETVVERLLALLPVSRAPG